MGCSFSRTQAEPAAHPLISAVELATSRGVSQAELRAYCAAIPTPPSTAAPLDWGAWVDGLVQWNAQRTALPPWPGKREGGGCEIGETALRGITLRQLRFIYAQASARCEADGWKSFDVASKSWSGPPISPAKLNLYELVQYWIKPQTAERGCSMVEQLADGAQPPRFFASHWWGEPVCEFIACVEQHVADHKHVGVDEDTPYWVCAYANNQHDIGSELSGDVGMSPFVRALHLADGIITIADENAIVLTRAWCGYEMFQATVRRGGSFAHDIYTALHGSGQSDARPAVGMLSGFAATDMKMAILKANREAGFPPLLVQRACGFELREAQASQATDLAAIMASVGTDLPRVNATVRIRFGSRLLPQLLTGGDPSQLATLCAELKSSELRALSLFADARVGLVSAAAVRQVAIALPPALVELTGWEIGSGALGALADRIRHGRLLRLKLQKCSLGDADAAELGAALGESGARLQELDLWLNKVGVAGASALAKGLERNASLRVLNLGYNQLGDEGASALAKALERNTSLTSLDLEKNKVGDGGATALAAALQVNSRLSSLNLRSNDVGDKGKSAICAAWIVDGGWKEPRKERGGSPEFI